MIKDQKNPPDIEIIIILYLFGKTRKIAHHNEKFMPAISINYNKETKI